MEIETGPIISAGDGVSGIGHTRKPIAWWSPSTQTLRHLPDAKVKVARFWGEADESPNAESGLADDYTPLYGEEG